MTSSPVSEDIESLILSIRGRLVMLDADLAALYGVRTKHLNQQVKHNPERFPEDFMFQLTEKEAGSIKCVPGANGQYRGRRHRPFAFTEQGAGMLVSVLRSPAATRVSIEILRTFARLRRQDELEPPRPDETRVRGLIAAIRDAVLCLPGDCEYTTEVPYTYFFQAGENGPIKVGWTRNLPVRLRALRAMSPEPLKLLGVMKGAEAEERCHAWFAAFRLHGQWFMPSPVVLDFIRENAAIPKSSRSLARD